MDGPHCRARASKDGRGSVVPVHEKRGPKLPDLDYEKCTAIAASHLEIPFGVNGQQNVSCQRNSNEIVDSRQKIRSSLGLYMSIVIELAGGRRPDVLVGRFGITITRGANHGIKNGENSRCVFRNLKIISNGSGVSNGAGINCGPLGSFPDIRNCLFQDNDAGIGGAIYCEGSSNFRATDCQFILNTATSGGAIYVATPTVHDFAEISHKPLPAASASNFTKNQLRHCVFLNNNASTGLGGAVYFYEELYAIGCQFVANTSYQSGGALACIDGTFLGVNLTIRNNYSITGDGAGIFMARGCWFTLVNTLGHHNEAAGFGGFISAQAFVRGSLVNVTSAENSAGSFPAIYLQFSNDGYCNNGDGDPYFDVGVFMRNCIFAENNLPWNGEVTSALDIDYCLVNNLPPLITLGGGNLQDLDPEFVNPTQGDFHLKDCSPCIDAADTRAVSQDFADADSDGRTACSGCSVGSNGEFTPDLDFRRRVKDLASSNHTGVSANPDTCPLECEWIVDMGAYEFAYGDCLAMGDLNLDGNVNGLDVQPFTDCATHLSEGEPDTCVCGDFNADGRVDIDDVPCFIELLLTEDTSCPGPNYFCEDPTPFTLKDCNDNDIPDANDIAFGASLDCNKNGVPDECDLADETSNDVNSNDIPDDCEPDCNGNSIPDAWDISEETSNDVNSNDIPDECEPDCNANDAPDSWDISTSASEDCNENGIPDECDEDCNDNDVPDDCDIADSTSEDCNENGVPDECDLARSMLPSFDCNDNDVPDECDIANETSTDVNENGIPDECEEESLWGGGGESMMSGGEGGGEYDAEAAWAAFYDWYEVQVFGEESDWHTLTGSQRFERIMNELEFLGLPYARPW